MNIVSDFENGAVYSIAEAVNSGDITFTPHAKFKGVAIKHLVTGKTTGGQISCHLVKVEPFCSLDTHVHEKNLEIHEIIDGDGTLFLGGKAYLYHAGTVGVIPAGVAHKVDAGKNGICILAKFTPALL
jgi:quercetin dioxygenase-like cupin family protein